MKKNGFTLIEMLVVCMVILIMAALLLPLVAQLSGKTPEQNYSLKTTNTYQCVKTYIFLNIMRVDLRPEIGKVETMVCLNRFDNKQDAASRYAQFEPTRWYKVTSEGKRIDGFKPSFPNIVEVEETSDPRK